MARLLKADKQSIMEQVLEEAAKDRLKKLAAREQQIGRACYLHEIKGFGKHIQAVPAGYYAETPHLTVRVYKTKRDLNSEKNTISFKRTYLGENNNGFMEAKSSMYWSSDDFDLKEAVRMPHDLNYGAVKLLASEPLGQEVLEFFADQEKLLDDLTKLGETVMAALQACTTPKKLIENYPELKKYVPAEQVQQLAVAHGKIESLMECTKKSTCDEEAPKKGKKEDVIAL